MRRFEGAAEKVLNAMLARKDDLASIEAPGVASLSAGGPECSTSCGKQTLPGWPGSADQSSYSAVVGSIVARTSEMLLAGNPAVSACCRMRSSLGAR
jgi:hypothetical protein